ncbi:DUF805 domain-containing protein [Novosphingobium mangrovi (ex Hu et al. 2023)]|uniref:DUF805 domain-containing protein n=1 Tax=Novosphingobium mangrovi (ex Hu et al. 2023) TaxID=2930094 RepID=A0ABT0A9M0_9SPHN|nr:DUF805 domain-containing protein [Novosphingobium mangrovi (ex Hu et al. 2023)]MCJ1959872.1 DUF805 domain-containing protein [Novosphingobium mangrovi (ex Hu et al. 2023)]
MNVIEPIRHCLSNLVTFTGRDSRTTFWIYTAFLVVLYFAVSWIYGLIVGGAMVLDGINAISSNPGSANEAAVADAIRTRMASTLVGTIWVNAIASLVATGLLAAAFVRRLHDSGKPGWIAGLAVALKLVGIGGGIASIPLVTAAFEKLDFAHPETMQADLQGLNSSPAVLLGMVPLLLVVVFGIMGSSDGDNRYGPEPDDY